MNLKFSFLFLILGSAVFGLPQPILTNVLKPEDQKIYQDTMKKCGSELTPIGMALDLKLLESGVTNWMKIAMMDVQASNQRYHSRFLSPEIARLRRSDGYWLAITHCYPESHYLVKQLIDLGHLATEAGALSGVVVGLTKFGVAYEGWAALYPRASKFLMSAGITLYVWNVVQVIKEEYFTELTAEQKKQISEMETSFFANVDETIAEVVKIAQDSLADIDKKLADPELKSERKASLLAKREKILRSLKDLEDRLKQTN